MNRAFLYAQRKGALVVTSAGNDNINLDQNRNEFSAYCDIPNAVCVSATGPTARGSVNGPFFEVDTPSTYSNYGRSAVTVAAPGGNNGIAVTAACSPTSLVVPSCRLNRSYVLGISGTSMATPHAAGVAALIVAEFGSSVPQQVAAKLAQSADDLGDPAVDPFYGHGRINAGNAVR